MTFPRCGSCKHWLPIWKPADPGKYGYCEMPGTDETDDKPAYLHEESLKTRRDFGCVMHPELDNA